MLNFNISFYLGICSLCLSWRWKPPLRLWSRAGRLERSQRRTAHASLLPVRMSSPARQARCSDILAMEGVAPGAGVAHREGQAEWGGLHSAQPAPSPGSSPPPVFLQASRDLWALLLSLCLGLFCVLVNWAVSTRSGGPRLRLHVWELGEASNSWSGESPRTCGRSMTA